MILIIDNVCQEVYAQIQDISIGDMDAQLDAKNTE